MSKGWAGGSTRAWRQFRLSILTRDHGMCQLKLDGCLGYGNQVHHLDGVKHGLICPPDRAITACGPCNWKTGDPTRTDPPPNPPRTNW